MKRVISSVARWLASPTQGPPGRLLLALLLAALALLALERGFAHQRAASTVGPGAYWIWLDGIETGTDQDTPRPPDDPAAAIPVAFFAAQPFTLDAEDLAELRRPEVSAALDMVADESYVVYLNGQWLGGNTFHPDRPTDRYLVTPWLRNGENRLVVELRSQRGVGGLLASLRLLGPDSERTVIATRGDRRIYRRYHPDLFRLDRWPPGSESARVWAPPPTGRWRPAPASGNRPIPFATPADEDHPDGPPRFTPRRTRRLWGRDWTDLGRPRRRLPSLGPKVLFDWGREVSGYLFFDLPNRNHPPALAWFGDQAPDPFDRSPDNVLIFTPGLDQWRAIHPRRFRYVLLIGVSPKSKIEVRRLALELTEALAPPPPLGGVFGIEPAHRYTAAEELVWERLHEETAVGRE